MPKYFAVLVASGVCNHTAWYRKERESWDHIMNPNLQFINDLTTNNLLSSSVTIAHNGGPDNARSLNR